MDNEAPTPAIKQGETATKELLQGDALAKVCGCGVGGPVHVPVGGCLPFNAQPSDRVHDKGGRVALNVCCIACIWCVWRGVPMAGP